MRDFLLTQLLFILGLKKIEDKLRDYNGYVHYQFLKWTYANKIPLLLAIKIIKKIKIYSSREIRDVFRELILQHKDLFDNKNTYITSFGNPDVIYKSGNRLITDFRNSAKNYEHKIIAIHKIPNLPTNSNIVFVDDLIGTGTQSYGYITDHLSAFLNPSHKPYLLCICGTERGLELIDGKTSFKTIAKDILTDHQHNFTSESCLFFNKQEKAQIKSKLDLIRGRKDDYNMGLLLAFSHSAPNNTIPIIWKENFRYNIQGTTKYWTALLPRDY